MARPEPVARSRARPPRPPARGRRLGPPGELLLVGGLTLLALALRWPNHQLAPPFTDETEEIYRALLVARGELLPLVNATPIIGSLWNYLLAAALLVSDFDSRAPRTLVVLLGVLVVPASYLLGRAWGGLVGGLLAAALMSTAAEHIVVNSHIAWSNCITPLFSTLGAWSLVEAVRRCQPRGASGSGAAGRSLLLAGLCWGLALQTHPTALALLPGTAVYLLWKARPLALSWWSAAAAGLFGLANLNLLVYNLASGFESLNFGADHAGDYTNNQGFFSLAYFARVERLAVGLIRHLGGGVDYRPRVQPELVLGDVGLWPIALLAATAVAWQWRRGNPLPGLLLGGAALILPVFNAPFEPLLNGRYLVPLLPVIFAAVGALGARALVSERLVGPRWPRRLAWGVVVGFVVLNPLRYLVTYYQQMERSGQSNAPVFAALVELRARRSLAPVLIDTHLWDEQIGAGDGKLAAVFRTLLSIERLPHQTVDLTHRSLQEPAVDCRPRLILVAGRGRAASDQLIAALDLRHLDGAPATALPSPFGLYQLPGCAP